MIKVTYFNLFLLTSIAPSGLPCAWNLRHYGDMSEYPSNANKKFEKPFSTHGCTVIESLVWPGWKKCI